MVPDERVTCFHEGQVWMSPKGTLYKVISVMRGSLAKLRLGQHGKGRIISRPWDAVIGWVLYIDA